MDWSTIIVAGLALIGTLAGSYFGNSRSMALMNYRLDQLEQKVMKHNNIVERMAIVERDIKELKEDMNGLRN